MPSLAPTSILYTCLPAFLSPPDRENILLRLGITRFAPPTAAASPPIIFMSSSCVADHCDDIVRALLAAELD